MRRLAVRLLAVAAFAGLSVVGFAQAAGASPLPSAIIPTGGGRATYEFHATSDLFCGAQDTAARSAQSAASDLLPIDRWASVAGTSLHTRLSAFPLGDLGQKVERQDVESTALGLGNTLWQGGTDLTQAATNFCFAPSLGYTLDHGAAQIGEAITSSGLLVGLVIVAVLAVLWRARSRSERPLRSIGRTVLILGLLFVMVGGAEQTHVSAGGVDFGTFSPGWLISKAYTVVDTVAAVPADKVAELADSSALGVQPKSGDLLGCTDYTDQLLTDYQDAYGSTAAAQALGGTPMALNAMWMDTGLRAYVDVQFGPEGPDTSGGANSYGQRVYCRVLDGAAGVPLLTPAGSGQIDVTEQAANFDPLVEDTTTGSLAWQTPEMSNLDVDRSTVAWAACTVPAGSSQFVVDPGWAGVVDPSHGGVIGLGSNAAAAPTSSDCQAFYDGKAGTSTLAAGPFEWTSSSAITSATTAAAAHDPAAAGVANFLLNWHGNINGSAITTSLGFLFASVIMFGVFAILALAVILAKVALLVVILAAMIFMVVSAFPSARSSDKALSLAKHAFGLILFATGAQLILAVVALLSGIITQVGVASFGAGSLVAILFTSFAPLGAILVVHHLFKMLRAPSPFKPSSALAWGAAAGGLGAGAVAAVDMGSARARQSAGGMARRGISGGLRRATGGRDSRIGGMTALGAGAGAAAGRAIGPGRGPSADGSGPGPNGDPNDGTVPTPAGPGGPGERTEGGIGDTVGPDGTTTVPADPPAGAAPSAGTSPPADTAASNGTGPSAGAAPSNGTVPSAGTAPSNGTAAPAGTAPAPADPQRAAGPDRPGTVRPGAPAGAGLVGPDAPIGERIAAAKRERAAARAHWREHVVGGGRLAEARLAARERLDEAVQRVRSEPIRTSLRAAGRVAGVAALTAVPMAVAGAGLVVAAAPAIAVGGAAYGVHKLRQYRTERPQRKMIAEQRRLHAYRAATTARAARPDPATTPTAEPTTPADTATTTGEPTTPADTATPTARRNPAPYRPTSPPVTPTFPSPDPTRAGTGDRNRPTP